MSYVLVVDTSILGVSVGVVDASAGAPHRGRHSQAEGRRESEDASDRQRPHAVSPDSRRPSGPGNDGSYAARLVGDGAFDASLLFRKHHLDNMGSMIAISGLVTEGLSRVGITTRDLAGVTVGIGPGSFTGIKVGLAFAYGLKTAVGELPILGVSALEAAARRLRVARGATSLLVLLPATRTHGFLGVATEDGATRSLLVEAETGKALDEAVRTLGGAASGVRAELVGDWPLMRAALEGRGVSAVSTPASEVCEHAIYGMAETTAAEWPAGFRADIPAPRYLRLSTAEEKLEQQKQQAGSSKP